MPTAAPSRIPLRLSPVSPFRVFSSGDATYGYWKGRTLTYGELGIYTYGQMEFVQESSVTAQPAPAVFSPRVVSTVATRTVAVDAVAVTFAPIAPQIASSAAAQVASASAQFASNAITVTSGGVVSVPAANASFAASDATVVFSQLVLPEAIEVISNVAQANAQSSAEVSAVSADAQFSTEQVSLATARTVSPEAVSVVFSAIQASAKQVSAASVEAASAQFDVPNASASIGFIQQNAVDVQLAAQDASVVSEILVSVDAVNVVIAVGQAQPQSIQQVDSVQIDLSVPNAQTVISAKASVASVAFQVQTVTVDSNRQIFAGANSIVTNVPDARFRETSKDKIIVVAAVEVDVDAIRPVVRNFAQELATIWSANVYQLDPQEEQKEEYWLYPV